MRSFVAMKYVALVALAACGGGMHDTIDAPVTGDGPAIDAAPMTVDDGTPTRQQCTNNLGNALGSTFGRMDGFLVAIVQPGGGACNADTDHVHLQVKMNGMIYDIAVDVGGANGVEDVHSLLHDVAMPGGPWSEGFHAGIPTDYVSLFAIHSTDLPLQTRAALAATMTTELASVNHISVYTTPYGPDGAHLVHRNGQGHDGMIVMQPLSTPQHARLFSFTDQTF
jgi:hypothetical protein